MLNENKARKIAYNFAKEWAPDFAFEQAREQLLQSLLDLYRSAEAESQAACVKMREDCADFIRAELDAKAFNFTGISPEILEATSDAIDRIRALPLPTDALGEAVRKAKIEAHTEVCNTCYKYPGECSILASLKGVS